MRDISSPTLDSTVENLHPKLLSVVVHDVAPATMATCQRLIDAIREFSDLPMTLLVVPRYHGAPSNPIFERWVDNAAQGGTELALHGFTHRDEGAPTGYLDHLRRRWYTAGEGEFSSLTEIEAGRLLEAGQRWFSTNGWSVHGFVAPAWLMSEGTRRALVAHGFDYTASVSRLIELPSQREVRSQSIVYSTRSAWRRLMSLGWNRTVAYMERDQPLLRFELHPPDVAYPGIFESWVRLLKEALLTRQPVTTLEATRRLFGEDQPAEDQGQASTTAAIAPPITPPATTSLG